MDKKKTETNNPDAKTINWFCLILGVLCIGFGLKIIVNPTTTTKDGIIINLSQFKVPDLTTTSK